jgi:hypothetical protein
MKRPLRLGEGMRDEQGWHATDCQPIVSRRSIRVRQIHKRAKTLRILVGATGFEPATPCAQGRCATRLRYAPTSNRLDFTAFSTLSGALSQNCRRTIDLSRNPGHSGFPESGSFWTGADRCLAGHAARTNL